MEDYNYDAETLKHRVRVVQLMNTVVNQLLERAAYHDESKFHDPERSILAVSTPMLAVTNYGTEEYDEMRRNIKVALDHHYANNRHHPESHENGINDMDLLDIMELFIDWKAATERHQDGNIYKSIDINKERFGMSEQLAKIFVNTAKNMDF